MIKLSNTTIKWVVWLGAYKSASGFDRRGDCIVRQQAVWSVEIGVDRDAHRGFSKEVKTKKCGFDDVQIIVQKII